MFFAEDDPFVDLKGARTIVRVDYISGEATTNLPENIAKTDDENEGVLHEKE